mmetsp:Transcript_9501/g.25843  ORF Transcript_9501/g.25843 Transcript_9501/m.25843 type:complete len:203 (-) Transcript_9501:1192-1800(-)
MSSPSTTGDFGSSSIARFSGLSWTFLLMPANCPPCSRTVLMIRNFSLVSFSVSSSVSPISCSNVLVTSRSSCRALGLFSFACFPLESIYFSSRSSRGFCVITNFIFCFGVRSPWRTTASTHRSSSPGRRPGLFSPCPAGTVRSSYDWNALTLPSSIAVSAMGVSSSSSLQLWWKAPCSQANMSRCGATALKIVTLRMPAASS